MQWKNITVITLAIFSISLLLVFDFFAYPAYAVTFIDIVFSDGYSVSNHTRNGVSAFSIASENLDVITTYRASDGAVLSTVDITNLFESGGQTIITRGIKCSGNNCYVIVDGSVADSIATIDTGTSTASWSYNFTGIASYPFLEICGGRLYVARDNVGNPELIEINRSTTPYSNANVNGNVGMGSTFTRIGCGTLNGQTYVTVHGSLSGGWFRVFNINNLGVTHCNVAGAGSSLDATSFNNQWYIASSTNVLIYSSSCVSVGSISSTNFCGTVQNVVNSGNILFASCDNVGTGNSVVTYDLSTNTKLAQYSCGANASIFDFQEVMDYSSSQDAIACSTYSADNFRIIIQGGAGAPENELCSDPQFADLLMCFEEPALAGASQLISNSTFDMFVQMGLIDGSDTNCATNGVGYSMTAVAIAIMVGLYWVAGRGQLTEIPTFLWMISVIAILGLISAFDCLDPTFLVLAVVIIVALAVAKIKKNALGDFS